MITVRNENCCKTIMVGVIMICTAIACTRYGNVATSWWIGANAAAVSLTIMLMTMSKRESDLDQTQLFTITAYTLALINALFGLDYVWKMFGYDSGIIVVLSTLVTGAAAMLLADSDSFKVMRHWLAFVFIGAITLIGNGLVFAAIHMTRPEAQDEGVFFMFLGFLAPVVSFVVFTGFASDQNKTLTDIRISYKTTISRPWWMWATPALMIALVWATPLLMFYGQFDSKADRILIGVIGAITFFGLLIAYFTCLLKNLNEDWAWYKSPEYLAEKESTDRIREQIRSEIAEDRAMGFVRMYDGHTGL